MSELPTLVLIPGAWHRASCYDKLTQILQKRDLKCVSITLPSTSGDREAAFKDDINTARAAIAREVTTHRRNVIVIAHSYGGMVANTAIKGFTRPITNTNTNTNPSPLQPSPYHVLALILITSGFNLPGLSFMAPLLNTPPPSWRPNWETGFAELVHPPRDLFYHDLPATEAAEHIAQLRPQSLKALFEGGEHAHAGWADPALLHVWYVGATEDRGLPVFVQRAHVGFARGMGVKVVHRELVAGHSVFLSRAGDVARIVGEVVEACGWGAVGGEEGDRSSGVGVMPEVRLFEPGSWISVGVPLALGHVIGKFVCLLWWVRGW